MIEEENNDGRGKRSASEQKHAGIREAAEQFYHELAKRRLAVRLGMEAGAHAPRLEVVCRLLLFTTFELLTPPPAGTIYSTLPVSLN